VAVVMATLGVVMVKVMTMGLLTATTHTFRRVPSYQVIALLTSADSSCSYYLRRSTPVHVPTHKTASPAQARRFVTTK
jgi:hypothetical protein